MGLIRDRVRDLLPATVIRIGHRRRVTQQVAAYANRTVTHTYWRWPLTLELPDPMAAGWYDHDWDEMYELQALEASGYLTPGATVFDIGAHQGVVALMALRAVGDEGRVIAVEAEPHNARAAMRNAELNDAHNLTVIHAAGSDVPGNLRFAEGLNGRVCPSTVATIEVPAVTVDELAAEHGHPAVVFIDVEGFESRVLAGAAETLARKSTAFLVEVHPLDQRIGDLDDVIGWFADGWSLQQTLPHNAADGGFVPFKGRDLGYFVLLATPRAP